jgi:hypothetical protein
MFCTPGYYPQIASTILSWNKCPWFLAYVPQGAQSPWLRNRGPDLNVCCSEAGNRRGTMVCVCVFGVFPITGWMCVSWPQHVVMTLPQLSLPVKHWRAWTLTILPWTMMEWWCCVRLWATRTVSWRHLGEWLQSEVRHLSLCSALAQWTLDGALSAVGAALHCRCWGSSLSSPHPSDAHSTTLHLGSPKTCMSISRCPLLIQQSSPESERGLERSGQSQRYTPCRKAVNAVLNSLCI